MSDFEGSVPSCFLMSQTVMMDDEEDGRWSFSKGFLLHWCTVVSEWCCQLTFQRPCRSRRGVLQQGRSILPRSRQDTALPKLKVPCNRIQLAMGCTMS